MEEILRAEHLRKTFKISAKQRKIERTEERCKVAVNDVSFSAYRGEVFGLLGPNGAGKTTTLRILSTLIGADSGDAIVCGCSVRKQPEEVRKHIGFMTSELKLESFFTPSYLFDFFSELHGVPKEKAMQRKQELFRKFGIDRFAEVKVGDLSTGMKQKASLVISIVQDPELIIFDEPTNGLDVLTAKVVTDFLIELKNMGKSIILSTHIFSLAEKICDRIGIIVDGNMIKEDTLAAITEKRSLEEEFFALYAQIKGENL